MSNGSGFKLFSVGNFPMIIFLEIRQSMKRLKEGPTILSFVETWDGCWHLRRGPSKERMSRRHFRDGFVFLSFFSNATTHFRCVLVSLEEGVFRCVCLFHESNLICDMSEKVGVVFFLFVLEQFSVKNPYIRVPITIYLCLVNDFFNFFNATCFRAHHQLSQIAFYVFITFF